MLNPYTIIVIVIVFALIVLYKYNSEGYNMGTIVQLQAKGPQDTYLTDDSWKYLYYPYGPIVNPWYGRWFNTYVGKKKANRYYGYPVYVGKYPYYDYMFGYW